MQKIQITPISWGTDGSMCSKQYSRTESGGAAMGQARGRTLNREGSTGTPPRQQKIAETRRSIAPDGRTVSAADSAMATSLVSLRIGSNIVVWTFMLICRA